jgi:two-component system response regulator ChvI
MNRLLCSRCGAQIDRQSPLIFDFEHAVVWWRGHDLHLTLGELRLMQKLIETRGACCSTRALYDVIKTPGFTAGAGNNGWQNNVRSMVKRIRHKFRKIDPGFDALRARNGLGYFWQEEA